MQIYSEMSFKKPTRILKAFDGKSLKKAFDELEHLTKSAYALGYVRYDAKEILAGKDFVSALPILYFEIYDEFEAYKPCFEKEIFLDARPQISYEQYKKAVLDIKNEISNGNTYEVNYTYDWEISTDEPAFNVYESLLSRQKTPYNTFINNEYETLMSFSPELFFELERESLNIRTKPMKGTVKRGNTPQEDVSNIEFLKNDEKNRAENVMIVDLLRNDLGRIAKTGTVKAEKLFEIETHKTLHQMTSEVCATLKGGTSFYDIFEAIFPCGSITGAPKISTMNIIDRVESGKRDIYCGAIGFITPQKAVFSVPIRILQKTHAEKNYRYRVGGAIVWDSEAKDEWEETVTKAGFLKPEFRILETMKVENGQVLHFQKHLERMEKTAEFFGFKFENLIKKMPLKTEGDSILRVLSDFDGNVETEFLPFEEAKTNFITVSPLTVQSKNIFLQHKTTHRPHFEKSFSKIKNGEIFDEIFFNEKGELTEGARSNIVLQIDGKLFTPPLSCGLLNGIFRQKMLNEGLCEEKILYEKDFKNAQKIFCINSVRGVTEVFLK